MIRKIIYNFLLYTAAFFISYSLQKNTLLLSKSYEIYYLVFIISWAISSLISRKFTVKMKEQLLKRVYVYTISFFLMLGILAFIIYNFNLTGVSRFVIFSSLVISYSIEIFHQLYKNKKKINFKEINLKYSSKAFTYDVLLFGVVNLYLIYKLNGDLFFRGENILLFINFYLSWFAGSFIGYQFHPQHKSKEYWPFIYQYIKSYIIILALTAFSGFINHLDISEIYIINFGVITYSLLSFIGISLYYQIKRHRIYVVNIAGLPAKEDAGDLVVVKKILERKSHYISSFNTDEADKPNSKFKTFRWLDTLKFMNFLIKALTCIHLIMHIQ